MSMRVRTKAEGDLLDVLATGEFSLEEAERTFLQMLEAAVFRHTDKILFDGRTVAGKPEMIERFYFSEFAANAVAHFWEKGLSPATQFAYVLQEPILDPNRFGETVAVNRFMHIKVFDSVTEALHWLKVSTAPFHA